jgi:penicillin-binding protein 1A
MHAAAHEPPVQVYAPYVAEMVRQEMVARFGGDVLTRGYHVTTTIDPVLQAAAQQALRDGLESYDHRHGWRGAEQHFDLAPDETAAAAGARVRNVAVQGGLQPAVVVGVEGSDATVAFADGSTLTLDADSSKWTGKTPAALLKRGDMVRVRPQLAQADGKAPATPHWQLEQLPRAQSALVSLDADTGALRALIGGYSFAANKFNRATQARRQPGSSFKPFLYAAAFERGFNPASIVLDAPVVFKDRRGHIWRPQNDTGDFEGPMRLREALVQSRNLVSVRLLDAIGVDYARRYISHFGIDEALLPPNLSMSLGTASLPPLTMARGYTVFANGGFLVTPWFIDTVRDRDGKVLFKEKPAVACRACGVQLPAGAAVPTSTEVAGFDLGPSGGAAPVAPAAPTGTEAPAAHVATPAAVPAGATVAPRAIDARVAYQLVSMMRDVVLHGTGFPARVLNREDVGGKTGSTNDHRDAWFSGFGGPYVTTVWVGRDDFQSLGYREYGGKAALPIWIDYMRVALKDQPVARNDPPDGMVKVAVGPGGRLLPESAGGIIEYVKAEDLERMQAEVDLPQDDQSQQEQSFDIF